MSRMSAPGYIRRGGTMRAQDRKELESLKVFQTFARGVRDRLIRVATVKVFPKGAVLWRRGEKGRYVYLILEGRVGMFDAITNDPTTVLDVFQAGALIAGRTTLSGAPYLFSGRAIDDVRAVAFPMTAYRRYLRADHSVLFATALASVDGWSRLVLQLRSMKQFSANQRLGFYLLALTGRRTGAATVRLIDDQLLIAGLLGVTRESLSRSFAQLRLQGVSKHGRTVEIKDVRRLRAYCESGSDSSSSRRGRSR